MKHLMFHEIIPIGKMLYFYLMILYNIPDRENMR